MKYYFDVYWRFNQNQLQFEGMYTRSNWYCKQFKGMLLYHQWYSFLINQYLHQYNPHSLWKHWILNWIQYNNFIQINFWHYLFNELCNIWYNCHLSMDDCKTVTIHSKTTINFIVTFFKEVNTFIIISFGIHS